MYAVCWIICNKYLFSILLNLYKSAFPKGGQIHYNLVEKCKECGGSNTQSLFCILMVVRRRLTLFAITGAIYGSLKIEFRDLLPLSSKLLPILLIPSVSRGNRDLSKIGRYIVPKSNHISFRILRMNECTCPDRSICQLLAC